MNRHQQAAPIPREILADVQAHVAALAQRHPAAIRAAARRIAAARRQTGGRA